MCFVCRLCAHPVRVSGTCRARCGIRQGVPKHSPPLEKGKGINISRYAAPGSGLPSPWVVRGALAGRVSPCHYPRLPHRARCGFFKVPPLGGLATRSRFPHFGLSYPGLGIQTSARDYFTRQSAPPLRASFGPSSQDCSRPHRVGSACSRHRRSRATRVRWACLLGCQGASGGLGVTPHRGVLYHRGCYPSSVCDKVAIRISYCPITVAYSGILGWSGLVVAGRAGGLFRAGLGVLRTSFGLIRATS